MCYGLLRIFASPYAKMAKNEKYRLLLTFDDISKNVKNAILT